MSDLLSVVILLAMNAFFVASEFAIVRVRQTRLDALAQMGIKRAKVAQYISKHLDTYLSACQVGITLASIGLGWVGEPFMARILQPLLGWIGIHSEKIVESISFATGYFIISFLHIVLGEMVPKSIAIRSAEHTALWLAWPLHIFYYSCLPFIWLLNTCSLGIVRLMGYDTSRESHEDGESILSEEEIRLLVARSAKSGVLTSKERILLENVLDFSDKQARHIMVPRTMVAYINVNDPPEKAIAMAVASGHTRFPLCAGGMDHVIGVVHVKDLFGALSRGAIEKIDIRGLSHKAWFIPGGMELDKVLMEFQQRQTHIAIVLDERGGASGIITLENVLEELVGQIQDEFDKETPLIRRISPLEWVVEGRCPLAKFEQVSGLEMSNEAATTVGGFVTALAGRIPEKGAELFLESQNIHFRIEASDSRRIERIRVKTSRETPIAQQDRPNE